MLNQLMFLAALCVAISILLRRSYRYFGRRRSSAAVVRVPRPAREERAKRDAPKDLMAWEVQMHETARELSAQLDSKMRALEILIREADEKIARAEALSEETAETVP